STQRFGKNHSSEFVQFELHIVALSHITLAMATCHWNSYSHRIPLAWLRQPVNLRCQDEIRLGQAIHRVGPGRDLDLAPSQQDVGMMALLLGQFAYFVHESQSGLKVGELVSAHEVMLVDDSPLSWFRQLLMNFCEFVTLQRRYTAAAGDAISVCK